MLVNRPPMGWNTWNTFGQDISDSLVRESTDAFVSLGLKDAGYRITNEDWLKAYEESYNEAKCRWRDAIWAKQDAGENLWFAYTGTAFQVPTGPIPEEASAE